MKNLLQKLVIWDWFVAVFFMNSTLVLFINAYTDKLENSDVVASLIHALIVMYAFTYFRNRKFY